MFGAISNLFHSEKAVATGALIAGCTYLLVTGQITVQEWLKYTEVMGALYVGGKTTQGVAAAFAGSKSMQDENAVLRAKLAETDAAVDKAIDGKFNETKPQGTRYVAGTEG